MKICTADFVPLPAAVRARLPTPTVPPKAAPAVHGTAVRNMLDYDGPRFVFNKRTANVFTYKRTQRGRAYRGS